MMASRPTRSLFRGAGRNALDLPVAGLAALAAAFAAFAVPQDLLSRAVTATGLPSILSAAQPPLGLTARVVLAVGGAVIVFGLVFLLLRLLDRSGLSASAETQDAADGHTPRVRRRDGHPDAPVPRPISAARDLGEPAPPRAPRPPVTPIWLDEAEPVAAPVYEPAPEPAPEPEPVLELAPEPEPVLELAPEPVPAPAPDNEPEPVFAPAPVAEASSEPEVFAAPVPEPEPAPVARTEGPASIHELMQRLEQGLARHRVTTPTAAVPETPPQVFPEAPEAPPQDAPEASAPPQAFPEAPEPPEDRLQSAIASLQRLAARSA